MIGWVSSFRAAVISTGAGPEGGSGLGSSPGTRCLPLGRRGLGASRGWRKAGTPTAHARTRPGARHAVLTRSVVSESLRPTDCGPPGSSVQAMLQARTLNGWLCPPPGGLPDPGTEPGLSLLLRWQEGSSARGPPGKPAHHAGSTAGSFLGQLRQQTDVSQAGARSPRPRCARGRAFRGLRPRLPRGRLHPASSLCASVCPPPLLPRSPVR